MFYVYVCLQVAYLVYVVDSLVMNSWPSAQYLMPERTHFLPKAPHSFLALGTWDSSSGLCFEAILRRKISNKKHKCKNKNIYGTQLTVKRTFVYTKRAETKKQTIVLYNLMSVECLKFSTNLCMSTSDCESATSMMWELQINFCK